MLDDADAFPQLIGDYQPVDQWQTHFQTLCARGRGGAGRRVYQTFAAADYRLAHALAADYYAAVGRRTAASTPPSGTEAPPLTVMEWGPGNGNLAACFLTHLQRLDGAGVLYPRVRYVLVDCEQTVLDAALAHPDLAVHRDRVTTVCGSVERLECVRDGSVDRIICNELWSELPTKLLSRHGATIEEEYLRPNVSEALHARIADWAGFVRAFGSQDVVALDAFPPFLDALVWEREYRTIEWKAVPYRKTITEWLKQLDEQVLVPVNLGAFATVKEALRLLAADAIGFSSFDAGTASHDVLNDPEKPCSAYSGGQHSFMVNFALIDVVSRQLAAGPLTVESQRAFVGRALGCRVVTVMDLLALHPLARTPLLPWEQDRLLLQTLCAVNQTARSPYVRPLAFPLPLELPHAERAAFDALVATLSPTGIPDPIAYLTEDELSHATPALAALGYEASTFSIALTAPPSPVDYLHAFLRPSPR